MDADEGAGAAMEPGEDAGASAGGGVGVGFRAGGEAGDRGGGAGGGTGGGAGKGRGAGAGVPIGVVELTLEYGVERKGAQAGTVATGAGGNAQSIESMDERAGRWAGAGADVAESVHTGGMHSGSP